MSLNFRIRRARRQPSLQMLQLRLRRRAQPLPHHQLHHLWPNHHPLQLIPLILASRAGLVILAQPYHRAFLCNSRLFLDRYLLNSRPSLSSRHRWVLAGRLYLAVYPTYPVLVLEEWLAQVDWFLQDIRWELQDLLSSCNHPAHARLPGARVVATKARVGAARGVALAAGRHRRCSSIFPP